MKTDLDDLIRKKGFVHIFNWLALKYAIENDVDVDEAFRQVRKLASEQGMRILELKDWVA